MKQLLLSIVLILGGFAATIQAQSPKQILKLFNKKTGVFDNKSKTPNAPNPSERPQLSLFYPVWKELATPTDKWFAFAWFSPADKENPLEHLFWHAYAPDGKNLKIDIYHIPNSDQYVQEWRKNKPFENLLPEELMKQEVCTCDFKIVGFHGEIRSPQRCVFEKDKSKFSKYSQMDLIFSLYPKYTTSESVFYDAKGNIILQNVATTRFYRISKNYKNF